LHAPSVGTSVGLAIVAGRVVDVGAAVAATLAEGVMDGCAWPDEVGSTALDGAMELGVAED